MTVKFTSSKNPSEYTHWTRVGTFRLSLVTLAGMPFWDLYIGDVKLGSLEHLSSVGEQIRRGEFDDKLKEPGASLNVPDAAWDWNGMR